MRMNQNKDKKYDLFHPEKCVSSNKTYHLDCKEIMRLNENEAKITVSWNVSSYCKYSWYAIYSTLHNASQKLNVILHQPKKAHVSIEGKQQTACSPLSYISPPGPITALASFPGSGNTWVRHLLQQATGE